MIIGIHVGNTEPLSISVRRPKIITDVLGTNTGNIQNSISACRPEPPHNSRKHRSPSHTLPTHHNNLTRQNIHPTKQQTLETTNTNKRTLTTLTTSKPSNPDHHTPATKPPTTPTTSTSTNKNNDNNKIENQFSHKQERGMKVGSSQR